MAFKDLFFCLFLLQMAYSDWVSEWMSPVQEQLNTNLFQRSSNRADLKLYNDNIGMAQINRDSPESEHKSVGVKSNKEVSTEELKLKLENTLQSAKILANTLKMQIVNLISRENVLKEAIINGRLGVTTVTVSTMNQLPRSYIIQDGRWMLCNGMIQLPMHNTAEPTNIFNVLFTEPRCIGKEVATEQDPCAFNSIIKYETVPTRRALEYSEDDFLCLKPAFNKTLERYMSVTQRVVNDTCGDGTIRSLAENSAQCGVRVLSEYSFYPQKSSAAASLPLEYCVEKDGSCRLIVAWHVSNTTIENFEFLKNEHSFKNFFITSEPFITHV